MEKAMTSYSSTLTWKIPWMEEPSRLQSMGSLRVRHDTRTLQCSCLENPRDGGTWWAAVYGDRTESDTTEVTSQQQQQPLSQRRNQKGNK